MLAHVLAYNKAVKTYGSNLVFATFSTYSARKGTIFFSIHKRLHTKKTQNMLQNIKIGIYILVDTMCCSRHIYLRLSA